MRKKAVNSRIELMNKQQGFIAALLAIVFGLFFVAASGFAVWAFTERSKYKNDVEQIVADEVKVAVKEAESAKDAEFIEQEKLPNRTYKGPETYGSVSFKYPKTWSLYVDETGGNTVLDVYGYPLVVPSQRSEKAYALRVEILNTEYDAVIKKIQSKIEGGDLKAKSFRAENVPKTLGLRVDGEIAPDITGAMVYLPLRDKTLQISTESPDFLKDFNNTILKTLDFTP